MCGRNTKINKKIHKVPLKLSSWNVRTLNDSAESSCPERKTALVARELQRYGIDIAALSETKLHGEGQLTEAAAGYSFFWKGKPEGERCEAGVGFAIRSSLLPKLTKLPNGINERIMSCRFSLNRGQNVTMLSIYAPTMTQSAENKEKFYEELRNFLYSVPRQDKLILMGDFNARVGNDIESWKGVLGSHGIGKMNSNGLLLLSLCQEFQLAITNTMFRLKNIHKGTWMHPRSNTWHMLDYVIVRQQHMVDVRITRVMRGADCWTDHRMVRSLMSLRLANKIRPQKSQLPKRLNAERALIPELQTQIQESLANILETKRSELVEPDSSAQWETLKAQVYATGMSVVGPIKRHNQDWFDENDDLIAALLQEKRAAHSACLNNPSSESLRSHYRAIQSTVQSKLRIMRDTWWSQKAEKMQHYADSHDLRHFYAELKEVYGPRQDAVSPVLDTDGQTLLTERDKILNRWAIHFNQLLNAQSTIDLPTFETMDQQFVQVELDIAPTLQEVEEAIRTLKNGKSPGMDGIPAELLKAGGQVLSKSLTRLYADIWSEGHLPQDFKDASIVHIYKRKGARTACDNHRGISLLSVPGKVLAKVIARRLYKLVADPFLSESQCGFRPNRGCVDMIFTTRQLFEKCKEQNMGLCATFIDLTKAFDSVNREGLWLLLDKLGCPSKFLNMIRQFHDGMEASVIEQGSMSEKFSISNGVKQGCTMAPTLFAIYFAAMLRDAFEDTDIGVYLQFRTSGQLFNLRRFQSRTKVFTVLIQELLFADDCGLFTHTVSDMQILMNRFAESASRFGLTISVKKSQVLFMPP